MCLTTRAIDRRGPAFGSQRPRWRASLAPGGIGAGGHVRRARKVLWLMAAWCIAGSLGHAAVKVIPHPKPDVGPIDMALRSEGPVTTPIGAIAPGDIAGSMPFSYLRTGVLNSNLRGRGLFGQGFHEVTRGSPGFFVGTYRTQTQFSGMNNDLWCFLPSRVGNPRESLCILMLGLPGASIAVNNSNPYWADPGVAKWPTGQPVDQVEIEERTVAITDTPILEYRFLGWTPAGAHVAFLVSHRQVGEYTVGREPDGSAHLGLIGGSYLRLVPDPDDASRSRATFMANGAAMSSH